jgi:hypothetical protein
MKSKTSNWFESSLRYLKTFEDGIEKKVTERYVLSAVTFADAEAVMNKYAESYAKDFQVKRIDPAVYNEIFFSDKSDEETFYLATVEFITIDEKAGREKRNKTKYLVQAKSLDSAVRNIQEVFNGTMCDYEIVELKKTNIVEVIDE